MIAIFYMIVIFASLIYDSRSNNTIKPTNTGNDKIRYFHKVLRVTHPITVHPHVTLLFRMKIGII